MLDDIVVLIRDVPVDVAGAFAELLLETRKAPVDKGRLDDAGTVVDWLTSSVVAIAGPELLLDIIWFVRLVPKDVGDLGPALEDPSDVEIEDPDAYDPVATAVDAGTDVERLALCALEFGEAEDDIIVELDSS